MASKGFLAISYQGTQKVEAVYKPRHTNETLNGYIVCCVQLFYTQLKIINSKVIIFELSSGCLNIYLKEESLVGPM